MFWVSVINEGSPSLLASLLKSLFGPVILSLFFFGSELISPVASIKDEVYVFAPRQGEDVFWEELVKIGSSHANGIEVLRSINWDPSVLPKPSTKEDPGVSENRIYPYYLGRFEVAFWNWIDNSYGGHWQRKLNRFIGISSSSGGGEEVPDAEPNPQRFCKTDIEAFLDSNQALKLFPNMLTVHALGFPSGTKLTVTGRYPRSIFIKTKNIEFTIVIGIGAFETMGGGPLAEKIRTKLGLANPQIDFFDVRFEIKTKNLRRWSPNTEKQIAWAKEFIENFKNDFSWELIRKDLESNL
jgi:hypothetical protein